MRRSGLVAIALALSFSVHARADEPTLRWSRPVEATEGWSRLVLPDDVVAACRPGLPDLRLRARDGTEVVFVPYDSTHTPAKLRWPVYDVETVPGRETTALVDRGAHPPRATEATIDIAGSGFLKPAVIEASDDARTWAEIGRGSIFAVSGSTGDRMTTIRFAPNDRRYWRLHFDDRYGPPVTPAAVVGDSLASDVEAPRTQRLAVTAGPTEGGRTTYEVSLPAANVRVTQIDFAPDDAVFEREVSVSERALFRDEIARMVIGGGRIWRGPAGESLSIPLSALRGPTLEIEVDDGRLAPLVFHDVTARIRPYAILFYASSASLPVTLEYGSAVSPATAYAFSSVLSSGPPKSIADASVGDAVDRGAGSSVGTPPRGGAIEPATWQTKTAVDLPGDAGAGGVAFLPLEGVDASRGLRLVDASSREVPFLFEQAAHRARAKASTVVAESPGRTTITISGLAALHEIDAIELAASAPDYFQRHVQVVEVVRDARGPVGERVLGSATWQRRPLAEPTPLHIALAAPGQSTFDVRIENGGDAPLTLGDVFVDRSVRRIDFVYSGGDSLSLLTGNAAATAPSYDLALLGSVLLSSPAQAAHLEPARDIAPQADGAAKPKWFWVAVIAAGLGVALALGRALKLEQRP